jgi:hypothetical protein
MAARSSACSIGSPTTPPALSRALDARTAARKRARSSEPDAGRSAATRIRFWVSVPVLSVQMTVVSPSVSIASRRRTIAPRRAIARAPSASAAVTVAANPSGTAATATATPTRNASWSGSSCSSIDAVSSTVTVTPAITIWRASRASRLASGVGGGFASAASASIRPSSVAAAVSQTSTRARPRVTAEPA